jgi:hypothetical protein
MKPLRCTKSATASASRPASSGRAIHAADGPDADSTLAVADAMTDLPGTRRTTAVLPRRVPVMPTSAPSTLDLLRDVLVTVSAVAYFGGFLLAIETALERLVY